MSIGTSLSDIVDLSKGSISFRSIQERLESENRRIELTGFHGSSPSLFLSFLRNTLSRILFVITADTQKADTIRDDLEGFLGPESVRYYPPRDVFPFEEKSVSPEAMGSRLETLSDLVAGQCVIVVAPVKAVLEKVIPPEVLTSMTIDLRVGQLFEFDRLATRLIDLGFEREPIVEKVGQFSLRGGIVDLYPFASENPLRLEFFGDTLESIRFFDLNTQRSIDQRQTATILPCSDGFERCDGSLSGETVGTLLSYFPEDAILFLQEPSHIRAQSRHIIEEIETHDLCSRQNGVHWDISECMSRFEEIEDKLNSYAVLDHSLLPEKCPGIIDVGVKSQEPFNGNLNLLRASLDRLAKAGYRSFIICDTQIQAERLEELTEDLSGRVRFPVGHLHNGFLLPDARLAVYTDHEIFRRRRLPHRLPKYEGGIPIKDYETLRCGDTVVHVDHGIGRFEGLRRITARGKERECLSIIYQSNDRLFIPIDELHRVQKYAAPEGAVPHLSKLGSIQWERTKERTKKALAHMAADLIKTDAARKAQKGHVFSTDSEWQKEMEAAFPYEETPDQLKAADEVKRDMENTAPMDRLICGDVGYGKTEVAIRASFKAVMDEKQVAVLVPTTILAQQHLTTFLDRFRDYPVRVEMLSRFRTKKKQREIVDDLKKGTVDIVIGTHRLLQKDVRFRDLGLVVVDEEHRFGVTHKERLKRLRTTVDVLTLTATPIPRTLHMSLMGARDMSIITTAPKERLPIQTEIVRFDEALIREAILREVDRAGQVYFVHNRVQSIHAMANLLRRIVPEISLGIAHGQMDERKLEQAMIDFLNRKFDCLVSTLIIEAGLDIPNVNTIIITRADRFGLAQLYQLRGRVGRSDKLAYAYLMVPQVKSLTETAHQRLQALQEFTELGSGFQLAMRDLEIRGAGNILGPQQHGFLVAVGFDLYCTLLNEAIKEQKGEPLGDIRDPKIEISVEAYIPDEYVPQEGAKMQLYQRLTKMGDSREIATMEEELRDRFGEIPKPVRTLLGIIALRILARNLGLTRISLSDTNFRLEFGANNRLGRKEIETLISKSPIPLEFEAEWGLVAKAKIVGRNDEEVLSFAKKILLHLL